MGDELLFRGVDVEGTRTDVRVIDQRIAEVGPHLAPTSPSAEVVVGDGGALLPGLHDHHVHLLAMASALHSVDLSVPGREWTNVLRHATPDESGWIRATGHHDAASTLDRTDLDRIRDDVPVRVQHRGGALWVLNTPALSRLPETRGTPGDLGVERDASGRPTGRLWRRDDLVRLAHQGSPLPDMGPVQRTVRSLGITGVTDASPDLDEDAVDHLEQSLSAGPDRLRLTLLTANPSGRVGRWARMGPLKILLHDHDLPDIDALSHWIRKSHALGRGVAVHCVSRGSLVLTLAALDSVGTVDGDRIEHAGVVPPELIAWIARLGLRVVTQPLFVRDRGDDYLAECEPSDVPHLYPYAALLAADIRVAPSSDAPYAFPDPWASMRAARDRLSRDGVRVGNDEGVRPEEVLRGYLSPPDDPGGPPRRIRLGSPADLCLLHIPLSEAMEDCSADVVRKVWVGGGS